MYEGPTQPPTQVPSQPWGAPPAPRRKKKNWPVIIIIAVVGAIVALAAIGAALGTDTKEPVAALTPGTNRVTVPTTTTTEDLSWQIHMYAAVSGLGTAMGDISDAAGSYDLSATEQACTDAEPAMDEVRDATAEVPDASIREPLNEAIRQYSLGLSSCEDGEIESATSYLQAGSSYLQQATSAVKAYNG